MAGVLDMTVFPVQGCSFGTTLPHFGTIGAGKIVSCARAAEAAGFDTLWVRDHLAFPAGKSVSPDEVFIDPFLALASAVAVTERISFGFATLVPHRHPMHTAALLAGLDFLAGPGRLVAGIGLGAVRAELDAVGLEGRDRRRVLAEYVDVIRTVWRGETDYAGEHYRFAGLGVRPRPAPDGIPISYCGTKPAGAARSARYCDAWGPVKAPLRDFVDRRDRLVAACEQEGRPPLPMGVSSLVSVGESFDAAFARPEISWYLPWVERTFGRPVQGPADLDGVVIAGEPDEVAAQIQRYVDAGARHFLFDLRANISEWEDTAREIGRTVLPLLRSAVPTSEGALT